MEKNKRLEELLEKYKSNSLAKAEYQELLELLNDSENLDLLDSLLDDEWENITKDPVESTKAKDLRSGARWRDIGKWKIAASILILVAVSVIYFIDRPPKDLYTTYRTDFAETLEVELPDGSTVTLNANSQLQWDNQWKEKGARRAILAGEAFFNVKSFHDKPAFIVATGEVSVEVVGTSFNVDNRDEKVEIYLDEGKVNLSLAHNLTSSIAMEPGQKIRYDAVQKKVEMTENETMISSASWKKGVLNFKDMEFREVLDKLKNIYGKPIQCEEEDLLTKKIYLGVPYSDWDAVMQALELSLDITFNESGDGIEITSNE